MIQRIETGKRMSQAVVHGGVAYLCGVVAKDWTADVAGQTQQVLDRIDELLAAAGTAKDKLLTANIWLSDMRTFDQMNAVWDAWVAPGQTPVRACVESRMAYADIKVEIQVTAVVG